MEERERKQGGAERKGREKSERAERKELQGGSGAKMFSLHVYVTR